MPDEGESQRRAQLDFLITFSNGGSLEGHDFRLDLPDGGVDDATLADLLMRDLGLTLAGEVRISNTRILTEAHKRGVAPPAVAAAAGDGVRLVDLSHTIEDGMVTYKGLPAPVICDFLSREQSRSLYAPGTEFHIGKIEMVANTGTYIDSPFHRFADGNDLSELALPALANLEGVVIRAAGLADRAIGRGAFAAWDLRGKAVLVETGWSRHWRTDQYFEGHPYLTGDAADFLVRAGAALVGIDSMNIDDTADGRRPVHTVLLGAGIPIVEHLRGLDQLPVTGFRFSAVPPKVRGFGTFPVRAHAIVASVTRG